jgi:hypothetical protein
MPLNETSGNLTTDAFGGGVAAEVNYIESVFSTWLYTGTGATQSIVNGIDLSTKGGLLWLKQRSGTTSHIWLDTARGASNTLCSNSSGAENTVASASNTFNTNGFDLLSTGANSNGSGATYASWTFRKQPKFFDVVTFNTDSNGNATVSHNLGSTPACIIIKCTSNTDGWYVYHSSLSAGYYLYLNQTNAAANFGTPWCTPSSTNFVLSDSFLIGSRAYVAYIFASNAGGFGLTGTDNVISCGSFTTDGSGNATVNLGYEPQWVMRKASSTTSNWEMYDVMRGLTAPSASQAAALLQANTSNAEGSSPQISINATGFAITSGAISQTFIYIAIRRGPMKVPTVGTSVYNAIARTGTGAVTSITGVGFPPDLVHYWRRTSAAGHNWNDRLRGVVADLQTNDTAAEDTAGASVKSYEMDGLGISAGNGINVSGTSYINHFFRRAPSFFDEVCYTGTGSATTITHNLGAVPEIIIVKCRNSASPEWSIYNQTLGNGKYLFFNDTSAGTFNMWNATSPTSSVFSVSSYSYVNGSGNTYVAYLFATCAGVSKVGSYTGNGTTQTIDCGFTGGARFVLIKRTDSTGDWYVYDTARGMTVLTDPYLLLNSSAAEVATLGSVTTVSTGFALNSAILAAINVSSATYIFLAVA